MSRFTSAAALILALAVPLQVFAESPTAPVSSAALVTAAWQHHQITVNYFGITSSYSCDALEQRVRDILLHFGARKDARVDANGCPGGSDVPSHNAWIRTDFYTLSPSATASSNEVTKAQWVPRELTPRRPSFMGDGDCELIEQMKDLISKNFSLRDVEYRTECVPHEILVNGFAVRAQALIPILQPSS